MTAYEPGTVAVATVRGVKGVRVFCTLSDDADTLWRHGNVKGSFCNSGGNVTDIRPLVVLDLAPGDAEEIVALLRSHAKSSEARCLKTADQIEAQTKPGVES